MVRPLWSFPDPFLGIIQIFDWMQSRATPETYNLVMRAYLETGTISMICALIL